MPTINKRFLLKTLLVLFALTGVLFAAHAVQARRIPAALKLQSERAADAGKYDLAVHYLRQYLEFNPEDVEALVRLAELLTKRAPTQRGKTDLLFLYDKILRIDPDRHATRREALTVSLEMGRYTDAITHAQALLEVFPTEAGLWQHLGAAQAGLNELAAARKSFETAVSHAPQELLGYQRLAQLLWKGMSDDRGAREVLDRMVKALPQDPTAYLTRAQFELFTADDQGAQPGAGVDLGRATRDLRRALELDPENADASLLLAEIMQRNRNLPAAHALLREAASLYPRNLKLVRHLSWLELIRGNAPAAITVLEDGLRASPDGFDLMVPLADLLVQQGDTARTADILRRLQERRAPATQVKYLQARVAMREEQWARAVALIEALRTEIVNLPGLETQLNLLLAACFQKLGDPAAEEKAYQRVTNTDPKNVLARIGLGNLYMNLGRFDDAARELDAAVQSPYTTRAVVAQWVKLRARLLMRTNSATGWQKLEAATANLAARFGRGSEVVVLRAELLAAQGRSDEAVHQLRKETTIRAGDARLWSALALLTADLSGCAAGLVVIDEGQAAAGDCADVRLARATLYAREPGHVRPLDALGEKIESWPENEQLRLLSGLVEVYDQVGDQANVVRTLRRIVARQPANVAMWLKLHERALPGDASAAAARAALVKLEGESGPSVLLCDARGATAESAAPLADRLVATFGENPTRSDACLILARLRRLTGNEPTAAALTDRAFLLEPTKFETAEAQLAQFARTGAADRTAQLLARLAADPRWAGEPFRRMVGHVLPALPPPVATTVLNLCRPLVELEPGGAAWVADRAVALKLPDALALIDAATQRPGATGDDWLKKALVVSKENAAAGPEVIAAAKARLTRVAHAELVAVFADSAAGSTFVPRADTAAEKRLLAQARLAVKLSRAQPAEAGKVLEAFLAEKDTAAADADWARRNLAMIYAVGGTQDDRARAMTLIKDATTTGNPTQAELRATVSVLSTLSRYLEGPDRRVVLAKAIIAQETVYKTSGAPTDLFALSQLYRAAGNRVGSRKQLQLLLSRPKEELEKDPSYPLYLTAALEELVDAGEFPVAEKFAGELGQLRVTDFRALAAIARYEAKAGRPDRGLAAAEEYARLADGNAGDYLLRSAQVAELLDELSRFPNVRGTDAGHKIATAAADRFAAIVPSRPEAIVGAAGVLAADGRAAEAFERIERLDRYVPTRLRASAGLAVVRGGAVSEQQAQMVLKWLDACLAEEPDSMPLLLNKAEFLARRSDIASAAATFEKALAKEPRNVVALNNLAWLLAADTSTAERALELVTRATREGGLTGDLLDTRARVRITLKQFAEAERDLAEAISHDPNALRWFHVAVLRMSQTPPAKDEAIKAFAEAKRRGLDARNIHPADLPIFRVLDK
jgi:tetratricopeptide (TPR) repeat protein